MKKLHSVWVVDDDYINRFLYEKLLATESHIQIVRFFVNGYDARLELLSMMEDGRTFPDIIFLDKDMPIMNGWEFLDWFKTLTSDFRLRTKIVMATASLPEIDKRKAAQYPCLFTCLLKPVNRDMLLNAWASLR